MSSSSVAAGVKAHCVAQFIHNSTKRGRSHKHTRFYTQMLFSCLKLAGTLNFSLYLNWWAMGAFDSLLLLVLLFLLSFLRWYNSSWKPYWLCLVCLIFGGWPQMMQQGSYLCHFIRGSKLPYLAFLCDIYWAFPGSSLILYALTDFCVISSPLSVFSAVLCKSLILISLLLLKMADAFQRVLLLIMMLWR